MTTLVNSFAGGTNGTAITPGNSGGASGSAFDGVTTGSGATLTYDSSHAVDGTFSAAMATNGTTAPAYLSWQSSLSAGSGTVWFRCYFYFAALPAGTSGLILLADSTRATLCAFVSISATGHLSFADHSGSQIHSFSTTVTTGQWFRVEGYVTGDPSAGQVSLQIYTTPDSPVPAETYTSPSAQNTGGLIGFIAYGVYFTGVSAAYWMDGTGASTAGYLGPVFVPGAAPLAGSGTIAPAGHKTAPGSASLSGSGVLATAPATVSFRHQGAVAAAGSGVLTSTGRPVRHGSAVMTAGTALSVPGAVVKEAAAAMAAAPALTCSYLSARIVISADTMFPANQSGTYGAAEAETTVIVPGVIDGTYT